MSALNRLLNYSKKHRSDYVWGTVFSVLNKFFDIAPEILIGMAIDVVASGKQSFVSKMGVTDPQDQIKWLAVITLFIWVNESLFEYLFNLRWKGLAQKIQHEARLDLYEHIQKLDISFFESKNAGALVSVINDDVNQLERFLNNGANSLIQVFTTVILIGSIFFYLSPQVALFSFLPMPVIIFGAFFFQKKAEPLYADVRKKVSDLSAKLTSNISGISTIKAFTKETDESAALKNISFSYLHSNQKAIRVSSAFVPLIRMAILTGFICSFVVGGIQALRGELNIGLYGVIVFLTQRLLWPLTGLADTVDLYQRAMASVNRIMDILDVPVKSHQGKNLSVDLNQDIVFENVSFDYESRPGVLKNVSLRIPAGKTVAFVGATGSGKSTIVKLLMRFYESTQGQIKLGQNDIKDIDLFSLRSQMGWVSQDVFLFDGTLEQNMIYGTSLDSKMSFSKVREVAEQTFVDEFAQILPQKYQTMIGDRGQKLSGGQKQRIALARAVFRNPKVLILDEATSAVDNETESLIQKSMAEISKNRTTILIAHRLSTVVHADLIYVVDQGQVAEYGVHEELLKKNQIYAKLWSLQVRE